MNKEKIVEEAVNGFSWVIGKVFTGHDVVGRRGDARQRNV